MVTDSPRSPSAPAAPSANGVVNSPQSRRRNLPSQWASVVRGDSELISSPTAVATASTTVAPASSSSPPPELVNASDNSAVEASGSEIQPEIPDINGDSNAGPLRRPAWNRPVNGVVDAGSVMGGAISWPALSESTRPVPRSSSDSFRPVSDGSASPSQVPILSQPPQRQANNNAHANSSANNTMSARPRTRNRGGSGGGGNSSGSGPSQNTFNRPASSAPPPFPVFEVPYGMGPPMLDASVRGTRPVGLGGSQLHTGNDYSSHRNNSRRGGYGTRPRGDGSFQNSHGGRRDRDRDRRDLHLPPQFVPPIGYMPSPMPPGAAPFMPPSPVRVFPGQMGFDMASPFIYLPTMPPESFRAMPMPPPPPPMLFPPANENPLTMRIVKQIDYYFSDENLVKDKFLKENMDDLGWVPITLIASFHRVQQWTKDIPLILESLRYSSIVEVQGDKVRRHNDWQRWLLSASRLNDSGSHEAGTASEAALTTSLQEVALHDSISSANGDVDTEGHAEVSAHQFLSEESTGRSSLPNGEDTSEEVRS